MSLTGKLIKDSYKDLLIVDNNNAGVDGTMRSISDGEGTASALQISETGVQVNGDLNITGTTNIEGDAFNYRGEWDGSTLYSKNDVVSRLVDSYVAKQETALSDATSLTSLDQIYADSIYWEESKNGQYVARTFLEGGVRKVQVIQTSGTDLSLLPIIGNVISASDTFSPTETDQFGTRVAISDNGQTLVVSSVNDYYYIFKLESGAWQEKLRGSFVGNSQRIDCDISEDGTKVVVGSYTEQYNAGRIRSFTFDGTSWTQTSELTGGVYDYYGHSVKAFNDFFIFTSHGYLDFQGAIFIYQYDATQLVAIEGSAKDQRLGVKLVTDYASDGKLNIFATNNFSTWFWYKYDPANPSGAPVAVDTPADVNQSQSQDSAPFGGILEHASDDTNYFQTNISSGAVFTILQKDYAEPTIVTDYEINQFQWVASGQPASMEVQVSDDNLTWLTIKSVSTFGGSSAVSTIESDIRQECKHIRLRMATYGSNGYASLLNWNVVGYKKDSSDGSIYPLNGFLDIFLNSEYANGFFYKSDGTELTIFKEDIDNNYLEKVQLETGIDSMLFINSYGGTDYLYVIRNGNIEIVTHLNYPSPEDDPTTWQTIAKGVTFNLAGVYTPETGSSVGYKKFDIVSYNGSSYIARNDVVYSGIILAPDTDPTNWQLFAQ